jgi:hypothetical protein
MKLDISRQILKKSTNITFHESPCSGSQVFPCGQTDGQADMTKLIVVFRNLTNAPKNGWNGVKDRFIIPLLHIREIHNGWSELRDGIVISLHAGQISMGEKRRAAVKSNILVPQQAKQLEYGTYDRSAMCNGRHVVVCRATSCWEQNVRIISILTGARDSLPSVPL